MSNDVVISKELRDRIIDWIDDRYNPDHQRSPGLQMMNELRTAPETVSLEGVPEGTESARIWWTVKGENPESRIEVPGPDISDLRRLVAPVQPSAVDIPCGKYAIPGLDGTVWKCGSKPASAKGKIILCDDCFGKLELWGNQKSSVQPSAVVSREDIGYIKAAIEYTKSIREALIELRERAPKKERGWYQSFVKCGDDAVGWLEKAIQRPQPVSPVQQGEKT